jgi:hypothetical protein
MNDRIPGLTWDNPIWHRGWRIYRDDCAGTRREGYGFAHDDYDGGEGEGPADPRHGWAETEAAAKAEIDQIEIDIADTVDGLKG